jgi:hypothetical protein
MAVTDLHRLLATRVSRLWYLVSVGISHLAAAFLGLQFPLEGLVDLGMVARSSGGNVGSMQARKG